MKRFSDRAYAAPRDEAEDRGGHREDRADLVGREVEAERGDQGDHRLDEGEDDRLFGGERGN